MNQKNQQKPFVGRLHEWQLLQKEYEKPQASLIIVYGRRRVGKTRLITEFYQDKNLWRFDGIEGAPKSKQIRNILHQLSELTGDNLYRSLHCTDWLDLFKILDRAIRSSGQRRPVTLFFDELPYMANRQSAVVSDLKWAWDNLWQHQRDFTLVLCGSIASFMVKKVVKSSALYGRVSLEICLKSLLLPEVSEFLGGKKSIREVCNLYMVCGGIPEYLRQLDPRESIAQNIARLAFRKDGYLFQEFDRLFKDVFLEEMVYKRIIKALARHKSLKASELAELLDMSVGGGFVDYLENLESAGFIRNLIPWDRSEESKLKRYRLDDEYLLFYFQFIDPNIRQIREQTDHAKSFSYLTSKNYRIWAGFAFERLCLKHVDRIMKALQIDQLVKNHGPYFDRKSNTKEGVQIDLLFVRHDPVVTLCEMKFYQGPVGKWVIPEVERKVVLLGETKRTVEKVLITTEGATQELQDSQYFNRVLLLEELF